MFSGCGQSPEVVTIQPVKKDPTVSQINAAKNGKLFCDFYDECEPALAMISVATAEGIDRCSGFLISDHEVLTNDHCLEAIPNRESACQGLLFAHFTHDVNRGCKRVSVRSHQNGINSQDYAIIELDEPVKDRKPLQVSRRGFKNNEWATIFRVQAGYDSKTESYNGNQTKLKCQASLKSLMNINVDSPLVPVMTFGDCAIQEGNSGSPMLNENGEVGAVVQGFLTVKGDELSELLKPYLLDEGYGEMAIASQTRCMPELVGIISKNCAPLRSIKALYPKQYLEIFGTFSEKTLPVAPRGMIWKEANSIDENLKNYVKTPECISNADVRSARFSFTAEILNFKKGINARLQAEWRMQSAENSQQALFEIQKPTSDRPTVISFLNSKYGKITLPVCGR